MGWIFAALNDAEKDLIVRLETGSGTAGWLVPHFDDLWQLVQSEGPPELPRTIIVIDPDGLSIRTAVSNSFAARFPPCRRS